MEDGNKNNYSKEENEALKRGKEILKKNMKKAQKIKKFFVAVKAAVVAMIALLKILWPILVVLVVVSLFTIPISGKGSSDEEDESSMSSVTTTQETNIDIANNEEWNLDETEIENFINSYDTGNEELKNTLKEKKSELKKWQDDNGYTAGFLITVIFEEAEGSSEFDLDSFLTEMNEKASKWKEEGLKTIQEIAKAYLPEGDETVTEWTNNIVNSMQKTAIKAGIITTGEIAQTGDGYDNIYISYSGKQYRNYKQIKGSYAEHEWIRYTNSQGKEITTTIKYDGCCLTSIAVIVSGYQNADINPKDIVMKISDGTGYLEDFYPLTAASSYGVNYSRPHTGNKTELTETQKNNIITHLQSNGPVIILVLGKNGVTMGGVNYTGNSIFTNSQHWMAILDYNEETNEVYLSNPSSTQPGKTGWIDVDTVLTSCVEYFAITNT